MLTSIVGAVAGYYYAKKRGGKKASTGIKIVGGIVGWYAGALVSAVGRKVMSGSTQPSDQLSSGTNATPSGTNMLMNTLEKNFGMVPPSQTTTTPSYVYQTAPATNNSFAPVPTTIQVRQSR